MPLQTFLPILNFIQDNLIACATTLAAILSAWYAHHTWDAAKSTLAQQMLVDLRNQYRSPQMFLAIQALWNFRDNHITEDEFLAAYFLLRKSQRL